MWWLTPWPEHSTLFWLDGHFVWSMYGYILTQVWFTHTKFLPQTVPSRTKPWLTYPRAVVAPLVVLCVGNHQVLAIWLIDKSFLFSGGGENKIKMYSLALILDSFDWYDCFGTHLIKGWRIWCSITIFALQWAALDIPEIYAEKRRKIISSKYFIECGWRFTYSSSHFLKSPFMSLPQWPLMDPLVLNCS